MSLVVVTQMGFFLLCLKSTVNSNEDLIPIFLKLIVSCCICVKLHMDPGFDFTCSFKATDD